MANIVMPLAATLWKSTGKPKIIKLIYIAGAVLLSISTITALVSAGSFTATYTHGAWKPYIVNGFNIGRVFDFHYSTYEIYFKSREAFDALLFITSLVAIGELFAWTLTRGRNADTGVLIAMVPLLCLAIFGWTATQLLHQALGANGQRWVYSSGGVIAYFAAYKAFTVIVWILLIIIAEHSFLRNILNPPSNGQGPNAMTAALDAYSPTYNQSTWVQPGYASYTNTQPPIAGPQHNLAHQHAPATALGHELGGEPKHELNAHNVWELHAGQTQRAESNRGPDPDHDQSLYE
jgi:hypothetical protein